MKDSNEDNFKQKGEGFGKMIAYTKLALESLQEGEKEIIKAKNIININEYMEFKSYVENILKDMTYKNQNIYYESLPDAKLLPRVDKLIKANPLSPTDDFNKFIEGQNSLDDMVPKEVKNMVDNYKQSVYTL